MGGIEAQSGFYYQNVLGALRALDLIELGNPLLSVSFDNPNKAQSIDDIVAEGNEFAEYTQVKWADDEDSTFTLANLTATDASNPKSLLRKIAEGFRQIEGLEGLKTVVLYSTKSAGTNALPSKGFNKSLDSFLKEFHTPFREDTLNSDPEKAANYTVYHEILETLYVHTGFSDRDSFANFLKSLRFDLGRPDRETLVQQLKMRLETLGIPQKSYGLLTNKVVEWSIDRINVRAEDVLRELGLNDCFVDSLKQNFPVDVERLVPVPYLANAIAKALDTLPSGYILLQGEPGVGKSTALTTLNAYRRDITFEYFCFIPNERSLGNERLDSSSFIRSLCIGLRNAFPDTQFPQTFSEHTKATLNSWLNFLSDQGKRVIFVVDGLDHVDNKHRQGVLDHPLTDALDGTLPPGAFMILSSQYIEALPLQVRDEVKRDPERLIPVRGFDEAETQEFFRRRHIELSDENLLRARDISGGIPIYLEYLATALSELHGFEQTRFLEDAPSLQDKKIDAYHDHLWHAVEQDGVAVAILSLLAIRQDFTTVDDLKALLDLLQINPTRIAIEESLKKITHVLRISEAQGYAIRHESFRLYVEAKTSVNVARFNEHCIAGTPTTQKQTKLGGTDFAISMNSDSIKSFLKPAMMTGCGRAGRNIVRSSRSMAIWTSRGALPPTCVTSRSSCASALCDKEFPW
jgi:NACHT domain